MIIPKDFNGVITAVIESWTLSKKEIVWKRGYYKSFRVVTDITCETI